MSREDYKEGYNDAIKDVLTIIRDVENNREMIRAIEQIGRLRLHR
jgi:hypothetical protein